ncbi:MAG: PAS domain S-box protein [Planctomycetota bacterium]
MARAIGRSSWGSSWGSLWGSAAVWTLVVSLSLWWSVAQVNQAALESARIQARSFIAKDVAYRRWNALLGGVYVPVTERTPPNPYLADLPERDIQTPSGKRLTLMNPAAMTRLTYDLGKDESGVRGHLTSLKPLRPENAPDSWETGGLQAFERGAAEAHAVERLDGQEYLRLIRPLIAEQSCLPCHAGQGYELNSIRGALSVAVPLQPLRAVASATAAQLVVAHGLIWLLGLGALAVWAWRLKQSEARRRQAEASLQQSHDRLEEQIRERTKEWAQANASLRVESAERRSAEEKYHDLYENAPDMFASVDAATTCVLCCNETVARTLGHAKAEIIGKPVFDLYHPDCKEAAKRTFQTFVSTGEVRNAELQLRRKDGSKLDVSLNVSAVRDADGRVLHSRSIWRDITERKRAEAELGRLNRALRAVSRSTQSMMRATSEAQLLEEICRIIVEDGRYRLAWVGYAAPDEGRPVRPIAHAGCEDGYLQKMNITWADTPRGRGPTGTTIRTGEPCLARHIPTDPNFAAWREEALKRGFASSLALPLVSDGETFGALNIYSAEPDAFDAEEVTLLMELAESLAFGITTLRNSARRQEADEALRRERRFPKLLIESSVDGIFAFDGECRFTVWNPAMERIAGVGKEDCLGRCAFDVLPVLRETGEDKHFLAALGGRHAWSDDCTYGARSPDRQRGFSGLYAPLRDADGGIVGGLAIIRDITEQREAELSRQESERQLRTLISNLPGMAYRCRNQIDWPTQFVSDGCLTLTGYSAAELLSGDPVAFGDIVVPEDRQAVFEAVQKAVAEARPFTMEYRIRRRDGRIRHVWEQGRAVGEDEDGATLLEGLVIDVTDRKEAEQRLVQTQARLLQAEKFAAIGRVSSGMAHEVNGPLAAIRSSAEILGRQLEGLPELTPEQMSRAASHAEKIQRNVDRCKTVIENLLGFARREAGDQANIDVAAVVKGTVSALCSEADCEAARVILAGSEISLEEIVAWSDERPETLCLEDLDQQRPLVVRARPGQIDQVVRNLVDNALFASDGTGLVIVSCRRAGSGVAIAVGDTGHGIAEEDLDHIFEPFFTTKEVGQGTGLGLYLVRRIVESAGGTIDCQSRKGKGTLMTVWLPSGEVTAAREM